MASFKYRYRVAWVDTDALGIMHFSNYFRLCERVEEEFTNYLGMPFDVHSVIFPRVKAVCEYKNPLKFNDYAQAKLEIKEIGKKHITYLIEIYNETTRQDAAKCQITIASISQEFKPIPIPAQYVTILQEFMHKKAI